MPNNAGFSLIEVIVSMLLLSLVLLGMEAMQMIALREAKAAYYFNVAAQQLNSLAARIVDTRAMVSDEQVEQWNMQNKEVLPTGRGVVISRYPELTLALFWGSATEVTCKTDKVGLSGCLYLSINGWVPQQAQFSSN